MKQIIMILIIAATLAFSPGMFAQKTKSEKAKDPVCRLVVDKDPKLAHNHNGETYYFCSKADIETFRRNPDKYTKKK
jgi:YHS domain-containing protein